LPFVPDVGNGFESDVGDSFVDEPMTDVAVYGLGGGGSAGDFGFFDLAFAGIG
jgi:hypothetical protein